MKNTAYVHMKFDYIFRLWSFIPFCLNIAYQCDFNTSVENELLDAIYRTCVAYIEDDISRYK